MISGRAQLVQGVPKQRGVLHDVIPHALPNLVLGTEYCRV